MGKEKKVGVGRVGEEVEFCGRYIERGIEAQKEDDDVHGEVLDSGIKAIPRQSWVFGGGLEAWPVH